jgi:hypothetical protein
MTPHIPEELSTKINWSSFVIMGNTMPPRARALDGRSDVANAAQPRAFFE